MEVSVPEKVGDGLGDSLVESRVVGARVGETVGKLDGAVEGTRLGAPYINKWRFKSQCTVHTHIRTEISTSKRHEYLHSLLLAETARFETRILQSRHHSSKHKSRHLPLPKRVKSQHHWGGPLYPLVDNRRLPWIVMNY